MKRRMEREESEGFSAGKKNGGRGERARSWPAKEREEKLGGSTRP